MAVGGAPVTIVGGSTPSSAGGVTAFSPQGASGTVTIASGTALSGAIDLGTGRLAKINMPAGWTAAVLTFQTSNDGVTYKNLYDAYGTEVSYTVAADRSVIVTPADWLGTRYMKVRSGPSAAPVNQGADRAIELVTFL